MTRFTSRCVDVYDLPLADGITILHPENVLLRLCKGVFFDIGALCYLKRSRKPRKAEQGREVDLSSFNQARAENIHQVICHLSNGCLHGGMRPPTLRTFCLAFNHYMNWCDSNDCINALNDRASARRAFRKFIEYQRRLVDQHQAHLNTVASTQNLLMVNLEAILGIDDLGLGINLLVGDESLKTPTVVPDSRLQEKALAWATCVFEGFSTLVVDEQPFPFALTVPGYLAWPNHGIWVFPTGKWCHSPALPPSDTFLGYDYINGRVRTPQEITAEYGSTKVTNRKSLTDTARNTVDRANRNFLCWQRKERGMMAIYAFFYLFIANTGMNVSQAADLPWNKELEQSVRDPESERQGFRIIKYRAKSRVVSFEIGLKFLTDLKRYLELRKYLLNGQSCDLLFYGKSFDRIDDAAGKFFDGLKAAGLLSERVTPRQMRAAKQDYVNRVAGPVVSAAMMQHSLLTAEKNYTNGTQIGHQLELTAYLSHVEGTVLRQRKNIKNSETNSIGMCLSPQSPVSIHGDSPVKPDCKRPEGCLFCEKFRVHADERDVRKLLSARYCIKKTAPLASSTEQFERTFGAVLQRIQSLLLEINSHDEDMVRRMQHAVEIDGELDGYWAAKLDTLIAQELVW